MNNLSFIIVAGGLGRRMKHKIPKQFIEINNKPILLYTLEKVFSYLKPKQIVVVIPENYLEYWSNIIKKNNIKIKHDIVKGGKERYYSVKNGLKKIRKTEIVAIHDGVRPLLTKSFLKKLYLAAIKNGNAIPYCEIYDTLVKVNKNTSYENRNEFICIQTPQFFRYDIIKKAYELPYEQNITDDSYLVYKLGYKLHFVKGLKYNLKITTQEDLRIIKSLL
ncbi:MAG: 2-C-methyl-D-erythritol 4-phosphate cytidylyltransferase [Bacteroidales bacterium]|nr:2-C-methyl-D-erythritol 4-phosphate cytidylyltransferase [Bacteroidales bacterium]